MLRAIALSLVLLSGPALAASAAVTDAKADLKQAKADVRDFRKGERLWDAGYEHDSDKKLTKGEEKIDAWAKEARKRLRSSGVDTDAAAKEKDPSAREQLALLLEQLADQGKKPDADAKQGALAKKDQLLDQVADLLDKRVEIQDARLKKAKLAAKGR
ncbi:MAG TPA: hypothetical protein PKA64_17560 [Myxococcota bacterium]|nr:hypothetical protein [Myxococcota bacterium]